MIEKQENHNSHIYNAKRKNWETFIALKNSILFTFNDLIL